MAVTVKDKDLDKLAKKTIGEFKSEKDFEAFTKSLRKQFWESTLEGEMDDHLGYEKSDPKGNNSGNSRNGKTRKKLRSSEAQKIRRSEASTGSLKLKPRETATRPSNPKPSRSARAVHAVSMKKFCISTPKARAHAISQTRSKGSTM